MENKKLGWLLISFSMLIIVLFFNYTSSLIEEGDTRGCFASQDCLGVEKSLTFSHLVIGVFSFLFALGFYMLFFNKTEQAILKKLESEKNEKIEYMKLNILFRALDPSEQKAVKVIKDQPGITQSTLRIRTDMSKAKLSYVLQDLEKKGLVKRIRKGKTLQVYLNL